MVVDLDTAFSTLTDTDAWMDVLMLFVGYMGAIVLETVAGRLLGRDVPPEAAGVAGMGLAAGYGQMDLAMGAGVYAVDQATIGVGLQDMVIGAINGGS
jgi:hypothetical protein